MKRFTLLFITPFFVSIVLAQPKVADFGKIDKSDFEIKDCDFDPGADALALFDVGDIQFAFVQGVGWQSESEYHVRIKVLNKNDIDTVINNSDGVARFEILYK